MNQTPIWAIWLPIVTAVVSGVFAFTGGVVAQWMTMGRERKLRARQFQIDMLVKLQDAVSSLLPELVKWLEDIEAGRNIPGWAIIEKWSRVRMLQTMVKDDQVRLATLMFAGMVLAAVNNEDKRLREGCKKMMEEPEKVAALNALYEKAQDTVGDALRKLL